MSDWYEGITEKHFDAAILRAVAAARTSERLPPLNDDQIKVLVQAATRGAVLERMGNASMRIVKAVERYHGIHATEALCPLCGRSIEEPPCSMNSDGAFHLSHPHNPVAHQPRLFRFKGGA